MYNKYFTLIAFLAISLISYGQQAPNAGFETWTNPAEPDGWYTFSSSGFVNLAGKDTANKVEGKASAKIHSATIAGSTTYEILSLGTADYKFSGNQVIYSYHPVYFPFRPDTFSFAYKYDSPDTDTATAYIKLIKGNTILLQSKINLVKNTQWSFPAIHLTPLYATSVKPDSLLIQFISSKTRNGFFGVDGSSLNVDKTHFGYVASSSVKQIMKTVSVDVSPNPFTSQITFALSDHEPATILLYDYLGRTIQESTFTDNLTIPAGQFENGIYFYELRSANGVLKMGKLVKQ